MASCDEKSTSLMSNRSYTGRFPEVLQFDRVLGYPDPEIPTLCEISLHFNNWGLGGIELLECLLYDRQSVGADLSRNCINTAQPGEPRVADNL